MRMVAGDVIVQCQAGDISAQADIEAVVNAANAQLRSGGGVAGAIHAAAGPELAAACAPMAPIRPGEAVITAAFRLPNSFVIHCLGPIYGADDPAPTLLARCYSEALRLAEERRITSVAFPAISTGAFGYPLEEGAEIACRSVASAIPGLRTVRLIRFVLFDDHALDVFRRALIRALAPASGR